MKFHETIHPLPRPTRLLRATAKLLPPQSLECEAELVEASHVTRDGVIIQPAPHHPCQPPAHLADRPVSAADHLQLDRSQRHAHAFGDSLPVDCEPAMSPGHTTAVGKAEEVERFRTTFSTCSTSLGRISAKLNQPGFAVVQLQAELGDVDSLRRLRPVGSPVNAAMKIDEAFSAFMSALPSERFADRCRPLGRQAVGISRFSRLGFPRMHRVYDSAVSAVALPIAVAAMLPSPCPNKVGTRKC